MKTREKVICECGGGLKLVDEVNGSYVASVSEDGVTQDCREFYGDSRSFLECVVCTKEHDFTYEEDNYEKILLIQD